MIWLHFSAGRGPGECQIAVSRLVRILLAEAGGAGVEAEILAAEPGPHGMLSALVALRGEGGAGLARTWAGDNGEATVCWICPSPLRPGWGRKNWFVGVSLAAPPDPARAPREQDLRFETMRASGPGGQHVNKTESAVRVTHIPSGTVATAREERSQHRNRALALARLMAALQQQETQALANATRARWTSHDTLERGNPIRVYEGEKFKQR